MDAKFDCYHVFNKSIAGYEIYRDDHDYSRMLGILDYYRFIDPPVSYSNFLDLTPSGQAKIRSKTTAAQYVKVLAYCLMPTHFHLVLELITPNGLSEYLRICLDAYTRYFNKRHARKGPLWQGRVCRVNVCAGEPFLYVTRYVHLNPVTAYMVENPKDWPYSSYGRYVGCPNSGPDEMVFTDHVKMTTTAYRNFVIGYKNEQRSLAKMKKLFLE